MAEAEKKARANDQGTEAEDKVDKRPRIPQEPDTPGKIIVSGLPKVDSFTEADLEKDFAPYGRITEVNIIRDKRNNQPRGFAFITYENPQDAEDASKALEGKDLGGETPLHCEQAVIGLRRSWQLVKEMRGGRGNSGRGGDRGRGRWIDRGGRGRGRGGMEMGGGRGGMEMGGGRGAMERGGGRGAMERGGGRGMRGRPHPYSYGDMEEMHQDDYSEEYYEPEPTFDYPRGGPAMRRGPPRGGNFPGRDGPPMRGGPARGGIGMRGGPPGRGMMRGRGLGPAGMGPPMRGGPPRRALLPNPALRGNRGGYGGPQRREEYYEEDGNGYQEEYYETQGSDPYAEEYEEQYPETEDYYTRDRPEPQPRGRGVAVPQDRRRPPPVDEYGYYDYQSSNSQLQAPAQRRNPAQTGYFEEEYEEATPPRMAAEQFERPRARGPPATAPVARIARGAAAPSRRGGMQQKVDPYAADESGMYESVSGPPAGGPAPGYEVESYGEAYGRRPAAPVPAARPSPVNRNRPGPPPADVYTTERPKPKPQPLMGEMVGQRRPANDLMGANAMQGRDAYPEVRRPPPPRRAEPEYREPYQMVAAETDAYVSYPPIARGPAELSRKRPIEAYEEEVPRPPRREFEEYRSAPPAAPIKRDRLDRNAYETYSSRQEGAYRGL